MCNEEREFKFKLRAVLFAGFPLNYTGIANESGNPSLCSEGEEVIADVIRTVDAGQNPPSPLSDFYGFTGSPLQDPVTACGPAVQEFILSGTLDVDEDYCIWGLNNLRSKIYMEPDAAIIVRSGVRLLLQYVDIVGCDEMWDRIKVESGGELIVENAYFQ
ncbi:MAG: hypothetical protein HUU34_20770, partial [Saprospiraceae bacterium]|nr:hypothetical protein [Saprospiraceae bacterium]